jgi:hypothetical protein
MKNPIIPGILIVQLLMLCIIMSMGAESRQHQDDQDNKTGTCQRDGMHMPPPRMSRTERDKAIAEGLGVTPQAFRQAMDKIDPHPNHSTPPSPQQRQQVHEALAKALNMDVEKVEQVMHQNRPRFMPPPPGDGPDHGRPVEAVARELGVTPEQFREAFKLVTPAPRGSEPTDAQRKHNREVLSKALGVSPEKLDEVMDKYRPEGPNQRPPAPEPAPAPQAQ